MPTLPVTTAEEMLQQNDNVESTNCQNTNFNAEIVGHAELVTETLVEEHGINSWAVDTDSSNALVVNKL